VFVDELLDPTKAAFVSGRLGKTSHQGLLYERDVSSLAPNDGSGSL